MRSPGRRGRLPAQGPGDRHQTPRACPACDPAGPACLQHRDADGLLERLRTPAAPPDARAGTPTRIGWIDWIEWIDVIVRVVTEARRPVASPMSADPASEMTTRTGNTVPETHVTAMFDSIAPVYDRMN